MKTFIETWAFVREADEDELETLLFDFELLELDLLFNEILEDKASD